MSRLEETRGPTFELTRHFVARMFDSELFATGGSWRSAAIGAFSMFLLTGVSAFYQDPLMRHQRLANGGMAAEAGRMMLFLAVSGLLGVLQWQALLPGKRDYLALASLPLHPRVIFVARFLAFLIFSCAAVAALNALPSLFAPMTVRGHSYGVNAAARALASSFACFFGLFSMVALQGALLNLLPGRIYARVSGYVQGICATLFFLAALESWHVADWAAGETFVHDYAWAPPVWFAALLRTILGGSDAQVRAIAMRALLGTGAALGSALSVYFVSYRRYRTLLLESSGPNRSPAGRRSPITLLVRDPRRAAIFDFMDKTLSRSRTHRLVLLGYAGLAFGLLINSALLALAASRWQPDWDKLLRFMTLYWPLTAAMVLIPGMRHALSIPVELPANWIFRMSEGEGRTQWMSAVETFIVVYSLAPIFVLLAPVSIMVSGWAVGLRTMTLQALVSLSIFELLFYNWQQLPFACSYAPGKRPLASIVGRYLGALFFLAPALSIIIATVSQLAGLCMIFAAGLGAFWIWTRRQRRQGWGEARLIYEDDPETLPDLGLKG